MKNIKSLSEYINEASTSMTASTSNPAEPKNYMFFQNLKTIKSCVDEMLAMDPMEVDSILDNGHDWASDHIATSKDDVEEVCGFLKNRK